MNAKIEPHKSTIGGMDANLLALIAYIASTAIGFIPLLRYFAWLAPLVIFFMEKESGFVKFHAMQAFVINLIGAALGFVVSVLIGGTVAVAIGGRYANAAAMGFAGIIGLLTTVISLVILVFAVIAMINAYKYGMYHIPLAGKVAENFAGRLGSRKDE